MRLRPHLLVPAILTLLGSAAPARADDDLDRARALFDEAGELEKQGQWGAAQDRLRAAIRIRETPHLRYALGWALENGGKLLDARTEYELAQRLAQRSGVEEVSRLAAGRIAEVDRKIPLVQVRVQGRLAQGTRVYVDDRPVFLKEDVATLPVDPGTRVVRIERPGKSAAEHSVAVAPGVLRVVDIRGDSDVAVRDYSDPAPARRPNTLPWVFVTGGGIAALAGVSLLVASTSDVSERDESLRRWCDATSCAGGTTATRPESAEALALRKQAYDAADAGNTKQIAGGVLTGLGAVGIAVGAYMLFDGRKGESPRASRVSVDASPLPGGGLGSAAIRF